MSGVSTLGCIAAWIVPSRELAKPLKEAFIAACTDLVMIVASALIEACADVEVGVVLVVAVVAEVDVIFPVCLRQSCSINADR